MRRTLLYLLVLALAIIFGLFIAHVPAFLLVQVGTFSVAMPLWVLFSLVFILTYLYVLIRRIMRRALIIPKKLRDNVAVMQQRQNVRKKIKKIEADIERARSLS